MQSDGGLTPMDNFSGSRAILSGPAGNLYINIITHRSNMHLLFLV